MIRPALVLILAAALGGCATPAPAPVDPPVQEEQDEGEIYHCNKLGQFIICNPASGRA